MKRETIMACGCVVTTVNTNIIDWKPHCDGHKKAVAEKLKVEVKDADGRWTNET